jgi:outer membrane protein assembly factor BamD
MGAAILLAGAVACGRQAPLPPPESVDADVFLYTRGTEALEARRWLDAREYFRRLVDTYPQSEFRYDAKLGIGDSYLGEDSVQSNIMAANEFREFLQFYPLNERADYAQYRLAISQTRQMLSPQRDQTATLDALAELDTFLRNYPDSELRPEVEKLRREVRDRLSRHEFEVGLTYYRIRLYPGAIGRFGDLLKADPDYSGLDEVLYYLAESYFRSGQPALALPFYEQLVAEYPDSEHRDDAQKRIAEIKL